MKAPLTQAPFPLALQKTVSSPSSMCVYVAMTYPFLMRRQFLLFTGLEGEWQAFYGLYSFLDAQPDESPALSSFSARG